MTGPSLSQVVPLKSKGSDFHPVSGRENTQLELHSPSTDLPGQMLPK